MVVCSTPISLPASEPIRTNNLDHDNPENKSALSAALRNSDLVESHPMHLTTSDRDDLIERGPFFGPMSLPQPRAPFLSSREGPKDALSRMPKVKLPENAVTTDPKSLASVQYGSLRESRFLQYRERRMLCNNNADIADFQSQSLPLNTRAQSNAVSCRNPTTLPPQKPASPHGSVERIMDRGTGFNDEEPSPSSSPGSANAPTTLTALDVLTCMKDSHAIGDVAVCVDGKGHVCMSGSNSMSDIEWAHQNGGSGPEDALANVDNDHHANPDTFEAFDFELNG